MNLKANNVDRIIILGDLTEEKDRHSAYLVNKICDHIVDLTRFGIVTILTGNHDYVDEDDPFFLFLGYIPNVSFINTPTGVGDALFLPHTNNYEREWEGIDFADYDPIFTHQTYDGAQVERGQKLRGIPTNIFPRDTLVLSGDIHVPQTLGSVTYVGAPYTIDFGDSYTPRVIIIDNGKHKSVEVSGPQKRLLEVSGDLDLRKHKFSKGDIIKVRVKLGMEDIARWNEIKDAVHQWGDKHGYQIYTVQPIVSYQPGNNKVTEAHTKSDDELLRAYAKLRDLDEHTTKAGLNLLRKSCG